MNKDSRLVYSTETGRIKQDKPKPRPQHSDGIIRIFRETKGRKGKGVTLISGFDLPETELKKLAKVLKQLCGTGGTTKDSVIEIQGDQRQQIAEYLNQKGHKVKISGG